MPLPFIFLFPGLLFIWRSFPFVFGAFYAPVWVFRLLAFRSPPPKAGPLRAPITSFSYRHLPRRCSNQIVPEPSSVDRTVFCFMFSLVSLYFVSFVLFFVLIFLCILFLLGFPVFALVFPCIAPLCVFCVFFGFYSSADLLWVCFAALRPLLGLFPHPYHVELPMRPSVYRVCLHVIGFICLYFYCFLFVISLVLINLLLGVMLSPDHWVVDVNIILALRSRRTSVGLGFSALSVKK